MKNCSKLIRIFWAAEFIFLIVTNNAFCYESSNQMTLIGLRPHHPKHNKIINKNQTEINSRILPNSALDVVDIAEKSSTAADKRDLSVHVDNLKKQDSLLNTPDGPKDQLKQIGVKPDVWVTQFGQGIASGGRSSTQLPRAYGGKVDAFLLVDLDKIGLWNGFKLSTQYEHYIGNNMNGGDDDIFGVSTAQNFIQKNPPGYKSTLSLNFSQDFGDRLNFKLGKFNLIAASANTPLRGGDGIETFMNVGMSQPVSGLAPAYMIGGIAGLKTELINFKLMIYDPRSALNPKVIEHPFKTGINFSLLGTMPTKFLNLNGAHTIGGFYATGKEVITLDADQLNLPKGANLASSNKKGNWAIFYDFYQNIVQSEKGNSPAWGIFANARLSNQNPNPINWAVLAGIGGNNLVEGRESDKWGIGYFYYRFSQSFLDRIEVFKNAKVDDQIAYFNLRPEGGIEAFYNYALTPWWRLTYDIQFIEPWKSTVPLTTYMATRLQTKF